MREIKFRAWIKPKREWWDITGFVRDLVKKRTRLYRMNAKMSDGMGTEVFDTEMERPIKFRAWNKQTKTMWYPRYIAIGLHSTVPAIVDNDNDGEIDQIFDQSNNILMQYTGLLDKNSKKIWEDSIVQSEDGLRKYKVVWNNVKGGWSLKGIGKAWFVNDPEWRKYEVIGHVHEPEDK